MKMTSVIRFSPRLWYTFAIIDLLLADWSCRESRYFDSMFYIVMALLCSIGVWMPMFRENTEAKLRKEK